MVAVSSFVVDEDEATDSDHRRILGCLVEQAELDDLDSVANGHAARFGDLPVDAEGDVSLARLVLGDASVARDRPPGGEIRFAGPRLLRRDRAATDVAPETDLGHAA